MFKNYQRKGLSEMRPYKKGEKMDDVSVSDQDVKAGSPKSGDMIARNPKDHKDQWLVAKKYFDDNLEPAVDPVPGKTLGKTLGNTTASGAKRNVKDIKFWGNGDLFRLISKAHSKNEGWMKSTKAMEIKGAGCVIQVTTQQGDRIAEALTFVPSCRIEETKNEKGKVISREIIRTV